MELLEIWCNVYLFNDCYLPDNNKLGYITFAVGIAPVLLRNGVIPIGGVVN